MAEHELDLTASLILENQKLSREVEDLKTLQSVVKENLELRSRMDGFSTRDKTMEKSELSAGKKSMLQLRDGFVGERSFRSGLMAPHRVSSPIRNPGSRPACPDASSSSSCQAVKESERLMGEIAFQLERRILSHVFYKQTRLYGFTVHNIQDKIIQVSTHPLTGQVDEEYRSEMTERYVDLMDRLSALGYNMTLHPLFTEFIINTYGLLKDRPNTHAAQEQEYNDLDVVRCVMLETMPSSLLKDMLVLFCCLCYMVKKDGKPVILW
ncbi:speriolin-like protein [Tachysurus vachellii]|uniref:speriolin-like protein n=1 Tax=Tachysurus vachellii TaxID=175792 RepID=UPI00296AFF96|nr:speriolin-like protein [Tachysurus vachellii]